MLTNSVELGLLHLCARTRVDDAVAAKIEEYVHSTVDWDRFVALIEAHRVLPLVWSQLQNYSDALPCDIAEYLSNKNMANVQRSLQLSRELALIAEALASKGIDILPFKGPALAQTTYGSVALRQTGDLDILVRTKDLHKACEVLLGAGWKSAIFDRDPAIAKQRVGHLIESRRTRHYEFVNASGIVIELHWEIGISCMPFPLTNNQLWSLALPVQLFGRRMYRLPGMFELLLLIHHGSKHGWYCLSWICDISEFVQANPYLNWRELFKAARKLHMLTCTKVVLRLASQDLGLVLPEEVTEALDRPKSVAGLCCQIEEAHEVFGPGDQYRIHENRFNIESQDSLGDRLIYVFLRATSPSFKDWQFLPLPQFLAPLYTLIRPVRLAFNRFKKRNLTES